MEFVYALTAYISVKLTEEVTKVPINRGSPVTNTRGATPRKDQAQVLDKGISKKVDKGKDKMIEPEEPKKAAPFPLQTGRALKIFKPKASVPLASPTAPLAKKSPVLKKKPIEVPPRVARALKLVHEEEDLEVEQPAEATPRPNLQVLAPTKELEVGVIKAPLVKKRKLKKVDKPIAPAIKPAALMIEPATLVI
jgi:hypothetical protein